MLNIKSKSKIPKLFYKTNHNENIYLFDISNYTNEKPNFQLITILNKNKITENGIKQLMSIKIHPKLKLLLLSSIIILYRLK